jgi:hypothetical protein
MQATPNRPMRRQAKPDPVVAAWRPRRSDAESSGEDKFHIPAEVVPPGMAWEWKRLSCLGQDDITHQTALARDGAWDPVPNSAWSDKLGKFGVADEAIVLDGMMLMQRPEIYNHEAREEEYRKASGRVSNHFASLSLTDGPVPKAKAKIKTDYSTQLVPADDEAE